MRKMLTQKRFKRKKKEKSVCDSKSSAQYQGLMVNLTREIQVRPTAIKLSNGCLDQNHQQ